MGCRCKEKAAKAAAAIKAKLAAIAAAKEK